MNINWYPGHMKKARQSLEENFKLIDIVYEILDARIPISSKNPDIDFIVKDKPRIIILNKMDLSSDYWNLKWLEYYNSMGIKSVLIDSNSKKGFDKIIDYTKIATEEKRKRLAQKGIKNKPIRAMIVGVPNVGKSTFINSLAGRKSAKTGNRPGVTKGKQWIKVKGGIELLDTPGILWPKFGEKDIGVNLAVTGAIRDEILDISSLSLVLIDKLVKMYPDMLANRYDINIQHKSSIEILDDIAKKRGCILKGGEIDYERVANLILDDFRKGRIGRITLEMP